VLLGQWLISSGLRIVLILVAAYVGYRLLSFATSVLTRKLKALDGVDDSEIDKRIDTLSDLFRNTGLVVIAGIAIALILKELGVELGPLLAGVGIVGLALGLGAQTLVRDVISGFFILAENLYRIGDVVKLQNVTGSVEMLTLRTTTLRDFYGTVFTIPNGDVRVVSNMTRDWSRAVVDVKLAYDADVDAATAILEAVGQALLAEESLAVQLLDEPAVTGVESIDDNQVTLRLMVKTLPGQQYDVLRFMRRQIKEHLQTAAPRQALQIIPAPVRQAEETEG